MSLAEAKRFYIFNNAFNILTAIGSSATLQDTFVYNPLALLVVGPADNQIIGNEIIDPMVVIKLNVTVNWGVFNISTWVPGPPTIQVDVCLIACNEQFNAPVPRLTSVSEDNSLFIRHPDEYHLHQFNSQNVTVIKRKRLRFSPKSIVTSAVIGNSVETKVTKLVKRLKGKKQYEATINASGTYTQTGYLKGWNYYVLVITTAAGNTTGTGTLPVNPIRCVGDTYMYYKDM